MTGAAERPAVAQTTLPAPSGADTSVVDEILAGLDADREELAGLVLQLANTFAPVGSEEIVARAVGDWYAQHGIPHTVVPIIEGRANTVARLRGDGTGRSLLFNAHLDTEVSGPDYEAMMGGGPDANVVGSWREGDRVFGHTAINDRHGHALFMMAARAVQRSGVRLRGDLVLTSVAGETGQAPVDEYRGLRYEGKGFGSSYLVEHGVRADYALVAETTGHALNWHQCGANYYKITVRGQNIYTPRLKRGTTWQESPNAIVKAAHLVGALEEWAQQFTDTRSGTTACGPVVPNVQVGAIRGGIPYRPNRSSPYAALYLDVRTLPGEEPDMVTEAVRQAVAAAGVDAEVDLVLSRAGVIGAGIEPLADAIRTGHRTVFHAEPPAQAEAAVVSMWRDTNVFNRAGIPSVTYGPSRGKADVQGRGYLDVQQLIDTAKVYALTILQVCAGIDVAAHGH